MEMRAFKMENKNKKRFDQNSVILKIFSRNEYKNCCKRHTLTIITITVPNTLPTR